MKKIILLLLTGCITQFIFAQNIPGNFSGSFETYTQFYHKDEKIGSFLPSDRIGSNNYLKVDYNYRRISAGLQFESYLPSILGHPFNANGAAIINKYLKYSTNNFSLQVGDYYEQFGSGMAYRSWENRQIGINNALEGVNIFVRPLSFLSIKALYGRPRRVLGYIWNSNVRGADIEFDFSRMSKNPPTTRVAIGGGIVSRYQDYFGPDPNIPSTVNAATGRLDIAGGMASVGIEYVQKGKDPHIANNFDLTTGKALLSTFTLAANNFGANLTFRTLENMDYRSDREATQSEALMNYIPALTRQHDYLVTNIYVYNPQAYGEIGGQADLFFNAPKGSGLGGKFGSNFALNYSSYWGHRDTNDLFTVSETKFFHDINLEWKKKWGEKFSSTILLQNLFYNRLVIEGEPFPDVKAYNIVFDGLLRYTTTKSFRFQLQHLSTDEDRGNWAAALTEFAFAPKWSFFLSDLYNYGVTDIHYPNVGGSYTRGGTRLAMNYGRQRAGLFCIGGVCRYVPASTGVTLSLTTTFN